MIDYVQVHRNADDGIEFFGGTVNAKHLILTDIQDDSVDWTQGWQGKIQFGLVKQIQDNTVESDRGFELDNLEQNNDASPRSGGKLANSTLLGKAGKLAPFLVICNRLEKTWTFFSGLAFIHLPRSCPSKKANLQSSANLEHPKSKARSANSCAILNGGFVTTLGARSSQKSRWRLRRNWQSSSRF